MTKLKEIEAMEERCQRKKEAFIERAREEMEEPAIVVFDYYEFKRFVLGCFYVNMCDAKDNFQLSNMRKKSIRGTVFE